MKERSRRRTGKAFLYNCSLSKKFRSYCPSLNESHLLNIIFDPLFHLETNLLDLSEVSRISLRSTKYFHIFTSSHIMIMIPSV